MSPTTEAFAEAAKRPLLHRVWRAIPPGLRTVLGIVCGIIATAWVVVCFLGTSVAPYDPLDQTTFSNASWPPMASTGWARTNSTGTSSPGSWPAPR